MSNIVNYRGITVDARSRFRLDVDCKPAPASMTESMEFRCVCGDELFVNNLHKSEKSLIVTFSPHLCREED